MTEQQEPKDKNPVEKLVNNRNFLVFLAFVVLSFFLWFLNYLNKELTNDITIKYKLKNVPKTISQESAKDGELIVYASGQGYNLLQEGIKTSRIPLNIDLESNAQDNRQLLKYTNNKEKAYIITSDLKPIIRKKVGEKINIGEIKPDTLYFDLINVKEKKVPIDISNISYKLIDGQKITKTIITPDSVTIIGQKSYVNNIDKIDVVPQNIGLLKNQKKYDFNLDIPDGISSSHNIASVSHEIEMYTKASKRIKIKAINIPADCTCTIIPQYVTVNYIVPISYYNNVTESNFTATVNYKNAKENTIEIKVQSDNGRIKIQRIIPETCSFILERK